MIQIYPKFIPTDVIDEFLKNVDWSLEKPFPNKQTNLSFICPIKNKINKRAKELGNVINVELLIYRENAFSHRHIDSYEFTGDYHWVMTGILMMTDPEEYEGGELLFNDLGIKTKCPKGTYITFPAGPNSTDYYHSVNKVISGQRNVLVYRYTK